MDCSVRRSHKYPDLLLVATTDFFYPLIEDPRNMSEQHRTGGRRGTAALQHSARHSLTPHPIPPPPPLSVCRGRIACANVLSDLYAMGVEDVDSVLMILAASLDMPVEWRHVVTRLLMEGFTAQALLASAPCQGGQSILNPWPIIGGTASALCKDSDVLLPHFAVAGDVLVLTKPLGIQVAVNVKQWSHQPDGDRYTRLTALSPPWTRYDTLYAYHTACTRCSI